jgi:hypothetical protein
MFAHCMMQPIPLNFGRQDAGSTGSSPVLGIDSFSLLLCCPLVVDSLDGLIPHLGCPTKLENLCNRGG